MPSAKRARLAGSERDRQVSTLAGSSEGERGHHDGPAHEARFKHPTGVAVDGDGNVIVVDRQNNVVRKVSPDGTVSTLAGSAKGE